MMLGQGKSHFPWQRFVMTLIFDVTLVGIMRMFVDWLYYFATLDPTKTSAGPAITALSAAAGVLFVCFSAVQIWFITGSTKSMETMFRFSAATTAASNLVSQTVSETRKVDETIREFSTEDLKERYSDK